jgi:hypothetical protein
MVAGILIPMCIHTPIAANEVSIIIGGLTELQEKTCVDFYKYTEAQLVKYDYVFISKNADMGCWSWIGRTHSGKQELKLPDGCVWHRIVMHEMMHALGFYHQHSTPDRDDYVNIYWENIQDG